LRSADFVLISENGFDAQDNAEDKNDYAWSMAYFEPDGADRGYVYVGTGNDMIGLIYQGISAVVGLSELGDVVAKPPEIRRYRDDQGLRTWERVLDYRDIEPAPDFETIGFRYMKVYRAQSDGRKYLYAATFGNNATVWRTATGEPGSWEIATQFGTVGSVRMMAEHNGLLYMGLANDAPTGERIGKIYATDGDTFWPVIEDGFGNRNNTGVMSLVSFHDWLYAGTMNENGYQVWKLEGPQGQEDPVLIVDQGGPSPANESAITPIVYKDHLYLGNMINPASNIASGFKAADIIRINRDDEWETVVGPLGISGFESGFNHWPNTYIWAMTIHEGWLYAATYDQVSAFFNVLENFDQTIAAFMPKNQRTLRQANIIELTARAGADLYKTQDGLTWYPVTLTGFRDVGNYGIRTLVSTGDVLYAGTGNPFDGLEIWKGQRAD
jgi:hypothetical protein